MGGKEGTIRQLQTAEAQRRASREDLLTPQFVEKWIELKSLGNKQVLIRSLSHGARRRLEQETNHGKEDYDEDRHTMLVICESVVEPPLTPEDIEALREQDHRVVDELSVNITVLNLLGAGGDLPKDSRTTGNSDSDLTSQNGSG